MPQQPMTSTLGRAAAVGPFFSVRTEAGAPREQGFVPFAEVYREGVSPALSHRVETVATRLGTAERRVAVSLVQQGLAGRLWSIALAPAVLAGDVPELGADTLWWHPDRSTPEELWLPAPTTLTATAGEVPTTEDLTARLEAAVVHHHLAPLHRALSAVSPVSSQVLWGNAASALVGTLRVLHGWCAGTGHREAAQRAVTLTASLLGTAPLRDTGTFDPVGPAFSRRSCCLYYRVPGGGLCGDCVLRHTGR
ncbi:(2Fe-2S)-binding protein [Streptomyces kronopolitis]|uniref:(2Fe-2S)-binding protein n=1 Tax=Streptomyces kronopolitis TaxID=1612435 RepID=UPI003D965139